MTIPNLAGSIIRENEELFMRSLYALQQKPTFNLLAFESEVDTIRKCVAEVHVMRVQTMSSIVSVHLVVYLVVKDGTGTNYFYAAAIVSKRSLFSLLQHLWKLIIEEGKLQEHLMVWTHCFCLQLYPDSPLFNHNALHTCNHNALRHLTSWWHILHEFFPAWKKPLIRN